LAPPRRSRFRWLVRLIGPAILIALFASIDTDELIAAFSRTSVPLLIAAYLMGLPPLLLRAGRLKLALGPDTGKPGFVAVLNVWAYASLVGTITPGRLGEFVKLVHLRRWGASLGSALATVLLERIPDIAVLFAVAAVALSTIALPKAADPSLPAWLALAVVLLGTVLVAVWLASSHHRAAERLRSVVPAAIRERLRSTREGFVWALRHMSGGAIAGVVLLTVCAWSINYLSNYLLSLSLGLELSYWEVAGISALSSFVALLPISVLGAGTRDAALVVVLAHYGIARASALALSTLFLSLMLCQGLMCTFSLATKAARFGRREPPSS